MPWPTDLHLFLSFWTGAFIRVQVSIPECHGRWTSIFYFFLDRCMHPCPGEHSRMPWPMDLHFYFFFPDRCMHPIPDKHFRVPKPTDLHLFIFLQPVASIQALLSIPQCLSHHISIYFLLFNYPPGTANFTIDHRPWHTHRWAEEQ